MEFTLELDPGLSPNPTQAALIWALDIAPPLPSAEPPPFLRDALARVAAAGEASWPKGLKERVRDMLRFGAYKPSGRGKPASEFLLAAALTGTFPAINPVVDVNNAVSLSYGYPGSVFDAELSGGRLLLRRGFKGESYVFNPSGQTIGLEDLLLVCRRQNDAWEPCGNPVKDAMITKIRETTRDVVAVLYAPAGEAPEKVKAAAREYARLLKEHCRAKTAQCSGG